MVRDHAEIKKIQKFRFCRKGGGWVRCLSKLKKKNWKRLFRHLGDKETRSNFVSKALITIHKRYFKCLKLTKA